MTGQWSFAVLTIVVSTASGLLIAATSRWWIADDDHAAVVTASRHHRPVLLVASGSLIAAAAALLHPALSPASLSPTALPGGLDLVLLPLLLGTAAAATPFLLVVDVLVHRLPDRLLLPLIAVDAVVLVLGTQLGHRGIWVPALVSAVAAAALLGLLHLVGRLLHARTLGLGDVKLAVVVGAVAGAHSPWALAAVFVVMMLIASAAALLAAWRRRALAGTVIAFGPAMLSGMWLGSMGARFLL
ncbi:leader peptidase (prepilin peptidase)/N-methyltransferase [Brevibacterium sanguinis]|uniref:Leader peptidase (Prepilin peptidase)/N-methyltransferase n=2 Tax=Brevibacterium TaxID=1696 RepID=A0A366IH18_9MICO|nr:MULTISPECIES: prepilin peptidase [Brevibacterium]RBP61575.1 leader peptidase (prepilin peptidase)/N-methyltransferase [Brevibacterium sanguinis]RBP70827.1 leader peptidase (prepilin peptidase)/N-methyltransferase [Brevibacterium celere]